MSAPTLASLAPCLLGWALLAAGCGDKGPTGSPSAASAGPVAAGASPFDADTAPWNEAPTGELWDLAAWVPKGGEVQAYRVSPADLRAHRTPFSTSGMWFEVVSARRRWVRELGLPEEALDDVIAVTEPLRFAACLPRPAGPAILEKLLAKGFREQDLGGVRAFLAPEAEVATVAWIDGRLVFGPYDAEALTRIAAVRAGREPSARDLPGVSAACAAVGPGLPVELEAYGSPKRKGPPGSPPVLAALGRFRLGDPVIDVHAIALGTESDRDALRVQLERMLADVPLPPGPRPTIGARGSVLRLTAPSSIGRSTSSEESGIQNDLGALTSAVERYASLQGARPSAAEGLAALARVPECLDDFLGTLPLDPWGRPYAYQPEHPKRPDGFVLRSLGPDGEIDTEDDVLSDR